VQREHLAMCQAWIWQTAPGSGASRLDDGSRDTWRSP
jgi:hypothetical protein